MYYECSCFTTLIILTRKNTVLGIKAVLHILFFPQHLAFTKKFMPNFQAQLSVSLFLVNLKCFLL